jgi:hypothetical protein
MKQHGAPVEYEVSAESAILPENATGQGVDDGR